MELYLPFRETTKRETQQEIKKIFAHALHKHNLSPYAAAMEIGISAPTMMRWFNNDGKVQYKVLVKIVMWLADCLKDEGFAIKGLGIVVEKKHGR